MHRSLSLLLLLLMSALPVAAQKPLDGASAPRWTACPGWVSNLPAQYGVTDEGGVLLFQVDGAGSEMPWQISFREDEIAGDARYLLVRYRAEGLLETAGNYFLHGYEGTPGGRRYADSDEVRSDGAWHTIAVDLAKVAPNEPTVQLAVKVRVGRAGKASLRVERVSFADELPAGAALARTQSAASRSVVLDWARVLPLKPSPGWTTRPATDFGAAADGTAVTFTVRGPGKQMRWPLSLPEAVDLSQLPWFSMRYRASGQLGMGTYAVWLGEDASGAKGQSCHPLLARDLVADGQWHTFSVRLGTHFRATQLAIGLDCAGSEAQMVLDNITFASGPAAWPVAKALPHEASSAPWPAGKDGFAVLPVAIGGGKPSPFFARRAGLSDWFSASSIVVGGVPFAVSPVEQVVQSGTAELKALEMALPAGAREVYLLTAAAAPPSEPFGLDSAHPRLMEVLAEPEKVVFEIRYAQGPPDFVLPLQAATGKWGLKRGLAVHVVHPDPARRATTLLLHDRMQTASFAILGASTLAGTPRIAEPGWEHLRYPAPPVGALRAAGRPAGATASGQPARPEVPRVASGALAAGFGTAAGLTWSDLSAAGLSVARGSVFEVEVGGSVLPAADWKVQRSEKVGAQGIGRRYFLRNAAAGLGAVVECTPGKEHELLLGMRLVNEGAVAVTATLRFPVLRGVRLGSVADTWYLYGRRGGIVNHVPAAYREPLGEPHPLQVDGFFNPRRGLALACMTHDTVAQHHFIRFSKGDTGGEWSPEYVERDLPAGASFAATEAALVLREGDWRAIFAAYRSWLATWYKAPAEKPWWRRTFSFLGCNAHYDHTPDPKRRGAIQPLVDTCLKHIGVCDYVHLFGWGASKQFGDWGDYGHYDETVGGKEYFRDNIGRAQAAGVGVGLYLDGYLSSDKGEAVGARAREWAMKRPDGSPNYVKEYDSYNQCPTFEGWREHLASTYARIHRDLGVKGMYIDEMGSTDGRWCCYAKDHGHNGYEIPYAAEVATMKGIRQAVGPEVALYTEYPSAEVSRKYLDGSFTYQALWSVDQEALAPHYVDMPRFAFPAFKQFHIIHYVRPYAGNWWLFKFPFFNGESYDLSGPGLPGFEAAALAFQKRAVQTLCAHREAFSSSRVEPLVRTEVAGVFANAFHAPRESVWTLYNANGRSVRAPVLRVKHLPGATYQDAWAGKALKPEIRAGWATLAVDLGPEAVGCVLQRR